MRSPSPWLLAALSFAATALGANRLDLAGSWQLRLDAEDVGMREGWAAAPLATPHRIRLPGTTDLGGFGFPLDTNTMRHTAPFPPTTRFPGVKEPERADEHGYLVRRHLYVGPAWYEREIVVPTKWAGRPIALRLERVLWRSEVWIDGRSVGSCDSLVAEHRHELGVLEPGRHRLTLRVDNRMIHNLSTITHAYGPETQSRWNGVVGAVELEAAGNLQVRGLAVYPAPDRRSARATFQVLNTAGRSASERVELRLYAERGKKPLASTVGTLECPSGASRHELTLHLGQPADAWDEFHPICYRVEAVLAGANPATARFGFRQVQGVGPTLLLNGRPLFLRGTLDCAVYPKTGHPPMTVSAWEQVLRVTKAYGFNHVRFHTWCPPDAAFEAADRLGLYLQPETAAWVDDWTTATTTRPAGMGRDPQVTDFLRSELQRMCEAYGNHPSFLLGAIGNEFGLQHTDWDRVNAMVEEIKKFDGRRLYTACGARKHLAADDYWFTHHTGASTRGIGPPHTDWDFSAAAAMSPVPLLAHETGQRPVFPNFDRLLPKFTGPLLPLNLERYRHQLAAHGLADHQETFVRASARFQYRQYKAEHEAMLRTRGYAGYQLLMLNDFTGQSEALVGILDPFGETKGVVTRGEVRAWNAPTVVLARMPTFVWGADEVFKAVVQLAHHGAADLPAGDARWELLAGKGRALGRGRLPVPSVPAGEVVTLGEVRVPLAPLREPAALQFVVRHGDVQNRWTLWAYPPAAPEPEPPGVRVLRRLDNAAIQALKDGGRVLLFAHGLTNAHAAVTGFASVYWSAGWWGDRFSSLGVTCDSRHPALARFPNDGTSDWQWRDLCQGATTFDLTGAPGGLRPIVQLVPDFHFNTLLGQVFEARVAGGSLLVCGYDLERDLDRRPAARQFRQSLLRYAGGRQFRPTTDLPLAWVMERCGPAE